MTTIIKILSILLFLGLISQGYGQKCFLRDLSVKQTKTGAQIKGKPEWVVTITNNCSCAQKQVILNCSGFKTVESVNPSIVTFSGNKYCLINGGNAIKSAPITFKYAWDTSFMMNPISSQIACA